MQKEEERSMQMFRTMDRMRRAWMAVTPKPEISKSQFGTLMVLCHGGRDPMDHQPHNPFEPMTLSVLASLMGTVCRQYVRESASWKRWDMYTDSPMKRIEERFGFS